jgi:hypothetical protein
MGYCQQAASREIPIAGISRVTGISEPWLQKYINQKYEDTPKEIGMVKKGRLMVVICWHEGQQTNIQ